MLDYPITTGPLEGINNKIKVPKCGVYGSREEDESFDFDWSAILKITLTIG
jgi:transposase